MRTIIKSPEPRRLTTHRLTPHSDYDNYPYKEELRSALVTEQRGLCCYCMGRISDSNSRIEHWRCQHNYREEQLNYRNLLGVCYGGEKERLKPDLYHCDKTKGDRDLKYNPTDPAHRIEARLYYKPDGSIRSHDPDFDVELDSVLNLNQYYLKENRKNVYFGLLEWWDIAKKKHGPVSRGRFERERKWRTEGTGELAPYCQVAVYWLEQRLARMQA